MSKASSKRRLKRHRPRLQTSKPISDRAVYFLMLCVGLFIVILTWLFTQGEYWWAVALGYAVAVAYLINFYTFQAYRGRHLGQWQQSLARVPLRFVGYGTKAGKPLEAAHDHPETRTALLTSIIVSLIVVAGLSVLLVPGLLL
jgi:Flp pilus assembly protein TadB